MFTENTLRKRANKIGYYIQKGFQHWGPYVYHDSYGNRFTGYSIMDGRTGFIAYGYNGVFDNCLELEDVEEILREEYKSLGYAW